VSIATSVSILQLATFTPEGPRDPLGLWGGRVGVTGDVSGGVIEASFFVPAAIKSAYVYACYGITYAKLSGAAAIKVSKVRLLTNWPNVDVLAGIQGYSTLRLGTTRGTSSFTAPIMGIEGESLGPTDRFVLLYDPRPIGGDMTIVQIGVEDNESAQTYAFECYGYFWDRSVMDTPGGPRHPGSA